MTASRWARVAEVESGAPPGVPLLVHPEWAERFPWLGQGTSHAGRTDFDLRIFGDGVDPAPAHGRLTALADGLGFPSVAYAHQLHGGDLLVHGKGGADHPTATVIHPGDAREADGHLTSTPGILLAVTVADCVPVSVVDPRRRAVALLHAGWRSAAAGILERAFSRLRDEFGSRPEDLRLHLGPSICGECYEVGPEVFAALDRPEPLAPTPIDLRSILAERARSRGVPDEGITISAHCTLHGESPFYSHRGGDRGRQMGFLGVRVGA